MTQEEAAKYYQDNFPLDMTIEEISDCIDKMDNQEDADLLRVILCNRILDVFSSNHIEHDDGFEDSYFVSQYKNVFKKISAEYLYLEAVYFYFCKDYSKTLELMKNALEVEFEPFGEIDEKIVVLYFQSVFKQGFDGFWKFVGDELRKYNTSEGVLDYCELLNNFYAAKSRKDRLNELLAFVQKYPDFISVRELLAVTYYEMGLWKNAIAYMETIKEPLLIFLDEIYFMLAWAHGKCKEYKKEEEYYRKSFELYPEGMSTVNNLAYCLYKQKRYLEAKELLEKCLEEKRDLPISANNYVRVLIKLDRHGDAKKFVKNSGYKIFKALKDRVAKLDNHNSRLKKYDDVDIEEDVADTTLESKIKSGDKYQQFSSEKILEDELTARIEGSSIVFGLNLKIYRREGVYGRQFIIPIGRLDLLCEDDEGNLYVIELKKDDGYDDAYKQITDYLDWFEQNDFAKGKVVHGILCMNSPDDELVAKVHADKRVRLFEYKISYEEV